MLHTTEAAARGSLIKLSDRGECHYCVTEEGTIYAIVDRDKEAFHAGRSMWNGKEDVDKFSVGIECVGTHDKPMPMVQLKAISELVKSLQKTYKIPDHCVVSHSHVAYGAPNKWHKSKHRGRKQCGMLFATDTIRRILGLKAKPASDADVRARRLVVGDAYLEQVLYRNVDIMARNYPAAPPPAPAAPAKNAATKPKTVVASKAPKSIKELKAQGYVVKGTVSPSNTAAKIAGAKWNAADTYYTIRDKVISGKSINPARIEKGMSVWMKKAK